ncbi:MAG: hypothetical protein JW829_12550 [Pirellulales bacterium]|nr:hypothetical protein [Pirellulales bacterium]
MKPRMDADEEVGQGEPDRTDCGSRTTDRHLRRVKPLMRTCFHKVNNLMRAALLAMLAAGIVVSGAAAADEPAPTVAEVFDAWSKRAESFAGGKIRWTISPERWNTLGRFETEWVPTSGPVDQEITGTLRFDKDWVRYDSMTFSYAEFGPSDEKNLRKEQYYAKILREGFSDPRCKYRDLVPYTVLYSDTQRIHYWHGGQNAYPRAVILPVPPMVGSRLLAQYTAFNSNSAEHPAGGPSAELHEWLAAPVILAFRSRLFDDGFARPDACRIDEGEKPIHAGRQCYVLRVPAASPIVEEPFSLSPIEGYYWIDPSRDFLVVRYCLVVHGFGTGEQRTLSQIDIHYDQVEGVGWIPAEWTVMRLHWHWHPLVVQQVVTAWRTHIDLRKSTTEKVADPEFAPGTWVKDLVGKSQYFVDENARLREFQEPYPMAYRYADLVERFGGRGLGAPWYQSKNIHRTIIRLTKWPRVLIPLTVVLGVLVLIQGVRFMRQRAQRRAAIKHLLDSDLEAPPS